MSITRRQPRLNALLSAALCAAGLSNAAVAEIYRWQDAHGRVHYGDRPAAGAQTFTPPPDSRGLSRNDAGVAFATWQTVKHVHDGDTVVLEDGTRVRLLGVNTPEIDSSTSVAESGGAAAARWLKQRIEGQRVRLEGDAEAQDHYGRTLAHLFSADGEHLNLALVQHGYASVSIFPPNLKYADQLSAAQDAAAQAKLGIWGDPAYTPKPIAELPDRHPHGWQRWYGRLNSVSADKAFTTLHFDGHVEARIARDTLSLFPDPHVWVGQVLELRGWASRRKDQWSILLRHPSMLTLYTH